MASPLRERRPDSGWQEIPCPWTIEGLSRSAWESGPLRVLSALIEADLPDGAGVGLQWHVSISRKGRRPREKDLRRALRAFGMVEAEEDNHHPGVARHFFLPVDPMHRVDCECKRSDEQIVEPDGYRWSNSRQGTCRGCEIAPLTGRPCSLHQQEEH